MLITIYQEIQTSSCQELEICVLFLSPRTGIQAEIIYQQQEKNRLPIQIIERRKKITFLFFFSVEMIMVTMRINSHTGFFYFFFQ